MSYIAFRRLFAAAVLATVALGATSVRAAASFSDIYFFGDSLSDTGNVFAATGGALPVAPYSPGRFSNGPVWTEKMASLLGHSSAATASLAGGNNFAFGGALTGTGGLVPNTGLLNQVGGMWNGIGDPNALYVVVAGGNDMRAARDLFTGTSAADNAGRQAAADAAAANLRTSLDLLKAKGAQYVMVASLPDLGATPEAAGLGLIAASTDATNRFNTAMSSVLNYGSTVDGLKMTFLDLAGISSIMRFDATANGGAIFGITDISHPCAGFAGSIGNACNISAFSDALHPSAKVHDIVGVFAAGAAMATLTAAVPEPETYAMLLAGLLVVGSFVRRKAA